MTGFEHIQNLKSHGAAVQTETGTAELTGSFYEEAVARCRETGVNAMCYELQIPGITERMMLAVHADGHVDSGSEKNVLMCLDR